jgi:small subunit ribosomal protein S9
MSETVVEKYKIVVASGKRKTSIAKAVVKPGIGRVWINGVPLEIFPVELARVKMMEPLMLVGDLWKKVDIKVEVRGGGVMSQAEATRTAIARGLLEYVNNDEEVKKIFTEYDTC